MHNFYLYIFIFFALKFLHLRKKKEIKSLTNFHLHMFIFLVLNLCILKKGSLFIYNEFSDIFNFALINQKPHMNNFEVYNNP